MPLGWPCWTQFEQGWANTGRLKPFPRYAGTTEWIDGVKVDSDHAHLVYRLINDTKPGAPTPPPLARGAGETGIVVQLPRAVSFSSNRFCGDSLRSPRTGE
jgi:hypothetical protein